MGMPIWGLVEGTLARGEDGASCVLRFAESEAFFAGHFPDYPIVPGMVMIESLVRLAQHFSGSGAPLSAIADAKFVHEVRPGEDIACHVRMAPSGGFAGNISAGDRPVLKVHFSL
jgi:3-hydroxyacyl-[acyl-carrier-protein] dehydratase